MLAKIILIMFSLFSMAAEDESCSEFERNAIDRLAVGADNDEDLTKRLITHYSFKPQPDKDLNIYFKGSESESCTLRPIAENAQFKCHACLKRKCAKCKPETIKIQKEFTLHDMYQTYGGALAYLLQQEAATWATFKASNGTEISCRSQEKNKNILYSEALRTLLQSQDITNTVENCEALKKSLGKVTVLKELPKQPKQHANPERVLISK